METYTYVFNQWGLMIHICVTKVGHHCSADGLSAVWCQAITTTINWTQENKLEIWSKCVIFVSSKCVWRFHPQNGYHFVHVAIKTLTYQYISDFVMLHEKIFSPYISGCFTTQRTNDAIITASWRQTDVVTSFWRNNNVIITPCTLLLRCSVYKQVTLAVRTLCD